MPKALHREPKLNAAVTGGDGLLGKLLAHIEPDVIEALLSQAELRLVETGAVIVERGAESREIGHVLEGTLAMVQVFGDEKKHIVGLLVPTDIFGRLFDGPSDYRIEALTPARILAFPRPHFERLLRENPEMERVFLVHLMDEMDAAKEWLMLISGRKVVNRLAAFLMILLRRSQSRRVGGPALVHVPLARKDLAHYLGARPETLSRAFHQLHQQGILRIVDSHHFQILDEVALQEAAGDDLVVGSRA